MLSQLLFVRLKAAENALRDGRLDEAYRLAMAPDIREHRRGAGVLAGLAERLLERARGHFRSERFSEALSDVDRADAGGVLKAELAELRRQILSVATEVRRQEESKRERIDAARRRIEGGSLAAGRKILEQASGTDPLIDKLRREAGHRMEDVERLIEQAEQMLTEGQFAGSAERLRRARAKDAHNPRLPKLEARLCERLLHDARASFEQGRLARAADELACLGSLGADLPACRELQDALTAARAAGECLGQSRFNDARLHAMSLQRLAPGAKWITGVIERLQQLEEIRTALHAGPLGERLETRMQTKGSPARAPRAARDPTESPVVRKSLDDTVALPTRDGGVLPDKVLLLVDGGGSFLLVRNGQASIGRAASDHPADVPLFSDVAERHANIARVEEDYFLFGVKDVEVGGHPTRHQLLRDGDRIVLGRRAKLTFRTPSRKSATAVLDLSDTTKMPHDVRRVVLFQQHATLGDGAHAHIRCRHAGPPLLLFERADGLWIRSQNDGHVDTQAQPLRLGEPVEIAGAAGASRVAGSTAGNEQDLGIVDWVIVDCRFLIAAYLINRQSTINKTTIGSTIGTSIMAYTYKHGDRPLDGFTIQRAVGRGGFGEVYYALSDGGREVALKVLRDNPEVELRGVSHCINLKSPHLVSIFDVKKSNDGDYVIIMEYISGPSLRDLLIAEPNGFPLPKAAFFCREIAKGLAYLHDRGIVHRDLKPGNIFFDDGYVKIGDYGLSKFISVSRHSAQTASVGTVHYMAPEVGSGDYSRGVDIYAMGVMLYEMVRGRVPFEGSSMAEILMKHLTSQPELDHLPQPFGRVIRKALEKDPRNRFATVNDMIEEMMSGEDLQKSVAGFSMPSPDAATATRFGGGDLPAPSPNPMPRYGTPAMRAGSPADREAPVALTDRAGRKWDRIDRMFERKLQKLGGHTGSTAADGSGEAYRMRRPGAHEARRRVALGSFLTVCLAVGLGVLFGSTSRAGFEAGISAALLVPSMAGGIVLSRWAMVWFGALGGPNWTLRLIRLCCSAPLLALGALPLLVEGSRHSAGGTAVWLGLVAVVVFRNWDALFERAEDGEMSFGSAVGTAVLALVATAIASGICGVEPEEFIFLSAGVAGVVSLVMQASSWWAPGRRVSNAAAGAAEGAQPLPPPPPQSDQQDSGFGWFADLGVGGKGVTMQGGAPVASSPLPPYAQPLQPPSGPGSFTGASTGGFPLVRWQFTRAVWGIMAFLLMSGGVICLLFSIMMTNLHPDERTGLIVGCSACFAFMIFAMRKTTPVKRIGFLRETVTPFLSSTAMFGIASLIAAITRHWSEMPEEGRVMSGAGLFICFVLLGLTTRAGREPRHAPFLVDPASGHPRPVPQVAISGAAGSSGQAAPQVVTREA